MVDMKKTLWSNRGMRPKNNQSYANSRQNGLAVVARTKTESLIALGALGSLLALLLIIGRGAGSG